MYNNWRIKSWNTNEYQKKIWSQSWGPFIKKKWKEIWILPQRDAFRVNKVLDNA